MSPLQQFQIYLPVPSWNQLVPLQKSNVWKRQHPVAESLQTIPPLELFFVSFCAVWWHRLQLKCLPFKHSLQTESQCFTHLWNASHCITYTEDFHQSILSGNRPYEVQARIEGIDILEWVCLWFSEDCFWHCKTLHYRTKLISVCKKSFHQIMPHLWFVKRFVQVFNHIIVLLSHARPFRTFQGELKQHSMYI